MYLINKYKLSESEFRYFYDMSFCVTTFNQQYKSRFYEINAQWLNQYYHVTKEDEDLLLNPELIIEKGGEVFFALDLEKDVVVGTCAMLPHHAHDFELIKMGVDPDFQGNQIGSMLIQACIDFAKIKKANLIMLETAVPLKAAIHLYEKFGFVKISDEYKHPVFNRVTFMMELKL